jgi:hypothetical protein
MYQTSVPSFVVPVFPAAGTRKPDPHTALYAVPRRTTSRIMSIMSHASSRDSTSVRVGVGSHNTSPRAFSTRRMAFGCARTPNVAKALYAATSSSGYTTAAPRWIDGYGGIGVVRPKPRAMSITVPSPSSMPRATVARLRDMYSARRIGIGPSKRPS